MIQDAQANKEADEKLKELVEARNQADNLIHATNKSMKELGDGVSADEKESIDKAIDELKELIKGEDKDAITEKTQTLSELSSKMAERLYAEKGAAEGEPAQADSNAETKADDGAVDAEFEEVKEDGDKDK